MFIELIDGLRCTSDHAPICLVAAITKRDDRHVIEGTLGCPTCRREYPIRDGVAWFRPRPEADVTPSWGVPPDDDGAMRIGAFLSVSDGITIALVGNWARYASELAGLAGLAGLVGLRVFAVNPQGAVGQSESVGVLYSDHRLPFKVGSLCGIAIDGSGWSVRDMELAARALSPGGRMVAPASSQIPDDIEEIARDLRVWIGEKRAALVALHRR